jgi:hypothetical protein
VTVTAELADGRHLEFPDGTDPGVVQATVKRLLGAGQAVPGNEGAPDASRNVGKPSEASFLDKVKGAAEAALTMATGATTGLAGRVGGTLGGIAAQAASGELGTPEGAARAAEGAQDAAHAFTFQPRTEQGRAALAGIAELFDKSKLAGLGPTEALAAASVAKPAAQVVQRAGMQAENAAVQGAEKVAGMVRRPERQMGGVGSAQTFEDRMRRERAAALPVPIKLSKGEATRDYAQLQFEKETAKNPTIGAPLREHVAENNAKILQNFDAWVDQTGAEAGSLRATGESVSQAVVNKSNKAKTEIRSAYNKARDSGEMQEKIDVSPIRTYLAEHQAEAINAPVLASVEAKLGQIVGNGEAISINGLEEIRKMVGRLSGKDATNATFGKDVKNVIDQMTEGRGGELYKQARALRFAYAKEFENQGVIDKLLSRKPGTTDRAVAFEDVFDHTVMKGSLDDVQAVKRTLQTAGPEGKQAWKELQGATIKHLKDEITKSQATDTRGNPVVSPARLNTLVNALDKDGKLDMLFGKKGAEQIRDVNGIAKDIFTSPPGSVNHSNTASILIGLLDTIVSGTSGTPLPIGTSINFGMRKLKDRALAKKVGEALAEPAP